MLDLMKDGLLRTSMQVYTLCNLDIACNYNRKI